MTIVQNLIGYALDSPMCKYIMLSHHTHLHHEGSLVCACELDGSICHSNYCIPFSCSSCSRLATIHSQFSSTPT